MKSVNFERRAGEGGESSWGKLGAILRRRRDLLLILGLVTVTVVSFLPLFHAGFIKYDDPMYTGLNTYMGQGLKWSVVKHIFTTLHYDQYYPVTLLSHALDCQLFGQDAALHHMMSLAIHVLNVILVFLVLRRMTRRTWRSVFVAALFAVHPLHVEAVAWIAERKELLCTLFALLAIWAYLSYVASKRFRRYFWVLFWFALSLLSKAMSVTLPVLLLLLDVWPLGRWTLRREDEAEDAGRQQGPEGTGWTRAAGAFRRHCRAAWPLVLEKIPLFAMSTLAGLLTIIANYRGGAITSLSYSPLTQRLATAAYAYGQYLIKTLFPVGLAVFYPLPPGGVPIGQAEASALLLVLITALVVLRIRKRPYLIVGWLWFLVALVPVVGLFQVGSAQAYADRYTYFSQIGLFLGITFWVSESVEYRTRAKAVAISVGSLLLIAFSWLTFVQAGYWRNSYTLFMHDLEVAPKGNYLASAVLGGVFTDAGDYSVAKDYLMKSIEARPGYYESWICLGEIAAREGDYAKAEYFLQQAFRLGGYRSPEANYYMGWVLGRQGKPAAAVKCLANAVRLQPRYLAAEVELARQLMAAGKNLQAKQILMDIIQRHPTDGQVRSMLDELARQSSSRK